MGPAAGLPPPAVRVRSQALPARAAKSTQSAQSAQSAAALKKSYPSNSFERGQYFRQLGKLDKALLEFIRAAHENPRNIAAFMAQAQIFKQKGNNKMAKSALEQALAVNPNYAEGRSMLVQLHFESGNLISAASEVGKLFNLNKKDEAEKQLKDFPENPIASAPAAAIKIAGGKSGNTHAPAIDTASQWLDTASGIGDSSPASAEASAPGSQLAAPSGNAGSANSDRSLSDLLPEHILSAAGTGKEVQEARPAENKESSFRPPSLQDVLEQIGNHSTSGASKTGTASGALQTASRTINPQEASVSNAAASSTKDDGKNSDSGIMAKVRANAGKTLSGIRKPFENIKTPQMPDIWKNPLALLKKDEAESLPKVNEQGSAAADKKGGIELHPLLAFNKMSEQIKDRLPLFGSDKDKNKASESEEKPGFVRNIKERIQKIEIPKAHLPLPFGQKAQLPAMLAGKKDGSSGFGDKKLDDAVASLMKTKASSGIISDTVKLNRGEDASAKIAELVKPASKTAQPQTAAMQAQGAPDAAKGSMPPAIRDMLKNRFGSDVVISSSGQNTTLESIQKKAELPKDIKAALADVPDFSSRPKDTPIPKVPGANYGLLKNNALTHVSSTSYPLQPDKAPLLQSMIQNAGKTFAAFVPRINWSMPNFQAFLPKPEAADKVVASVVPPDNLVQKQVQDLQAAQAAQTPAIPLNISRILSKISPAAHPQAEPLTRKLSASVPIGGPSVDIDMNKIIAAGQDPSAPQYKVPQPQHGQLPAAPDAQQPQMQQGAATASSAAAFLPGHAEDRLATSIPNMPPSTARASMQLPEAKAAPGQSPLNALPEVLPSDLKNRAPLSGPQGTRPQFQASNNAELVNLPPIVQEAIKQAEPIVKPALDAASNLAQSIAPMLIPKSETRITQPVQINSQADIAANNVPNPVAPVLDMERYMGPLMQAPAQSSSGNIEELSAAGLGQKIDAAKHHQLVAMQKSKSGAFTYMKPLFDSDRDFMFGTKQVRTIPTTPSKAAPAVEKEKEEDPITKRMRYLQGGGTLRRGEAFMFSEETGEGTLFLPDGSKERRQLQFAKDPRKVLEERRPDIVRPKDLQYSLNLLGKLLPQQQQQNNQNQNGQQQPVGGPTLEQLMNQMNQNSKGFWGWMKKSFNI